MIISPRSTSEREEILWNLAKNVGRRAGVLMKPIDSSTIQDRSGAVHWMCNFDEHESRVYRIQDGSQAFVDINLGNDHLVDLDDIEDQVQLAIERLKTDQE